MFLKECIFAFRQLRRSPGFSVLAILTLALGIGISTAMFTVVDSVLLKPLSYHDSGRLAIVWERVKFLGTPYTGANPPAFRSMAETFRFFQRIDATAAKGEWRLAGRGTSAAYRPHTGLSEFPQSAWSASHAGP